MSSAPASAAHGHDAHDVHVFTGEPVQVLPADEPRSPGWLPLLGIALFTGAAVVFLAGQSGPSVPVPAPVAKAAPPPPSAAPAPVAAGSGAAADAMRKLSPEQIQQMRKRLEENKAKGTPAPGRPSPVR
jgi:hypothetical protein